MRKGFRAFVFAWFALTTAAFAQDSRPLVLADLVETSTVLAGQATAWMRFGVPLSEAAGVLSADEVALVTKDGRPLVARRRIVSRWGGRADDVKRPAKWIHVTTAAPADSEFRLVRGVQPPGTLKVDRSKDVVTVTQRFFTLEINARPAAAFLAALRSAEGEATLGSGGELHLEDEAGKIVTAPPWVLVGLDADDAAADAHWRTAAMGLEFNARLHLAAESPDLVLDFQMVNRGPFGHMETQSAHVYFRRVALSLPALLRPARAATARGGVDLGDKQLSALSQHVTPKNAAYPAERMPYQIWHGTTQIAAGERLPGALAVGDGRNSVSYAVERFWSAAPKALAVAAGTVILDVFPAGGTGPEHWGQYGDPVGKGVLDERSTKAYRFEGGRAYTTRAIVRITASDPDSEAERAAATVDHPIHAMALPEATLASKAVGVPYDLRRVRRSTAGARFERMMEMFVDDGAADSQPNMGQVGMPAFIARGGTYGKQVFHGWLNDGDLAWGDGYSSLHYDWPFVMLLNYLRSGDPRHFETARAMSRHRADIDQDHDALSTSKLRGGQFYEKGYWHGNYYHPAPSHTWLGGPVLHYLLTGDEGSLEAAKLARDFFHRQGLDQWGGDWGVRIPGWTIEAMLWLWWAFGDPADLDYATAVAKNVERIESERFGKRGFVINRQMKPASEQPWMMNIFFNAVARHALLTGSEEFRPFMRRMLAFFDGHTLAGPPSAAAVYRYVNPETGLKKEPGVHLAWPMCASFAYAALALRDAERAESAVALFEGAVRRYQESPAGELSPIAFRMMNYPASESKIWSNIALWGMPALALRDL